MDFSNISNWLLYALLAWLAVSTIAASIIGRFLATVASEGEGSPFDRSNPTMQSQRSISKPIRIPSLPANPKRRRGWMKGGWRLPSGQ